MQGNSNLTSTGAPADRTPQVPQTTKLQPIRTLFVNTTLTMGGAERVIEQLVTQLDRESFNVEVLTLREPGKLGDRIAKSGIPVHHGWTGHAKLDLSLIPKLHRWLRRERFEILYFLDHPHAIFHGTIASWGTDVKVRVMPVHTTGRWGGAASVPRSTRLFLPWIDSVIAIAQAQRDYLIREEGIPPAKLTVIPNGIPSTDPDESERAEKRAAIRAELSIDDDARVVTILAVLRPEKNHELLLSAIARIRNKIPKLTLLIVGDGPRRDFLTSEVERLDLGGMVRFLGHQPDGRRFWAAADLAVLSSHPQVETLPLSLLEAMDFALPVVSTDVGALRELVTPGENGELVTEGAEEDLAAAIETVLRDPDKAKRYGEQSQRRVREEYRSEKMVRRTEELLIRLHSSRA